MGWIFEFLILVLICVTIIGCTYMYLCSENQVGLFEDYVRSGRLRDLEIKINRLQDEVDMLKEKMGDK